MRLSKLWEMVMGRKSWRATVCGVTRVGHDWVTELNWRQSKVLGFPGGASGKEATTQCCSVQFSRSVMSDCLRPHGLQHTRPPCPSPTPGVHLNSCLLSRWCHPTISFSVVPFSSCPQSFPASGSFPMSQLFTPGGQTMGASASASFLPMRNQDWFPLGLTGLISLQSKGLSRVF